MLIVSAPALPAASRSPGPAAATRPADLPDASPAPADAPPLTVAMRADPLAGARKAAETLEAMLPMDRAARAEADRATPAQRREGAAEFFTDLLDHDGDGKVGRDEFVVVAKELFGKEMAEKLFERMDRDRDGRLGGGEMELDLEKGDGTLAELFRRMTDGDGNGIVESGEFRLATVGRVDNTRASRFLQLLDRTGDGRLTPRELRWAFGVMREDGGKTSPFLLDRAKLNLLA